MKEHSEYQALLRKYKAIDIAKEHLRKIDQRITTEQATLKKLDGIVEKEYQDVQLLEKKSLQSIFQKILGSNTDIEKEKQEYLHAVLQYNECQKLIELLIYEKSILEETIKANAKAEEQLKQIIRDHKAEIFQQYPLKGDLYFALDEALRNALDQAQALKSSQRITTQAQQLIGQMINLLSSAKHNGTWGDMPTHARASKRLKNENMDKAQTLSYQVKQIFQELEDMIPLLPYTQARQIEQIQISKEFNKMYYTELISDWVVHSEIVSSINYLQSTADTLKKLDTQFIYENKQCEEKIIEIDQRKRKLILNL